MPLKTSISSSMFLYFLHLFYPTHPSLPSLFLSLCLFISFCFIFLFLYIPFLFFSIVFLPLSPVSAYFLTRFRFLHISSVENTFLSFSVYLFSLWGAAFLLFFFLSPFPLSSSFWISFYSIPLISCVSFLFFIFLHFLFLSLFLSLFLHFFLFFFLLPILLSANRFLCTNLSVSFVLCLPQTCFKHQERE